LPVLEFNQVVAEGLYAELGRAILPSLVSSQDSVAASAFIDAMRSCVATMPYALTLRDAGIKQDSLPMLAKEAMKVQRLLVNNPRDVLFEDALGIYQAAY